MNRLSSFLLLPIILAVGCIGTSDKLNRVSIGMTKPEVIRAMGKPHSSAAKANVEYLIYTLAQPKSLIADERTLPEYFVRLVDGRVDSYGKKGDFDTTKDPEFNFNLKIKADR